MGDTNGDGDSTDLIYTPFAVYRVKQTGEVMRLFGGFWDTNGDGAWSVNVETDEAGELVYDWTGPTYGAESYEPIYCWQGYDAAGNEIEYDPANEAQYAAENALYKICKNFKPKNKNLRYLITDTNGKILKNSYDLNNLIKNTKWKKL